MFKKLQRWWQKQWEDTKTALIYCWTYEIKKRLWALVFIVALFILISGFFKAVL